MIKFEELCALSGRLELPSQPSEGRVLSIKLQEQVDRIIPPTASSC